MDLSILKDNKKYLLIYLLLAVALTIAMLGSKNYQYWGFEAVSIPILFMIGIISIIYSIKHEMELHKVVLILIIIFGLILVFLAPPMTHPDEMNHYTRAELLSEGVLYPQKTDSGYLVEDYYFALNEAQKGLTIFDNPHSFDHITDEKNYTTQVNSSPFYSYIPSMLGILLAKCLNLADVFALFFSRLANLLLFGGAAYYAIKKAPAYKIGLALIATMPLTIAQVSSTSYDAFILTLTMIILAYFIKMYKDKAENKDLAIFFISILLISLIKPPYILLSLIILIIPKENFSVNEKYVYLTAILIFVATLLSVSNFLTPSLPSSNNTTGNQITFILNNPLIITDLIKNSITLIPDTFILNTGLFHYADFKGLKLYNIAYMLFFILFSIFYKQDINLEKNKRLLLSLIFLMCYFSIFLVLYIIWTPIGSDTILGVQARYFIPIMALLPLIINYESKSQDKYEFLITIIITFLVGLILLTITHYY